MEYLTLSEFRAARHLTAKRYAHLVEIGAGPVVTMRGRTQVVSLEAARAFDIAAGNRVVAAFTSAAKLSTDNPEEGHTNNE